MRLEHVGIKTSDIEKSLHFYCDILGLQRIEDVEVYGKTFYFVGNENALIEIEAGGPDDTQAAPRFQTGLYHLAFIVEDVKGMVERLKKQGVSIALEPMISRSDRLTAFVEDPDGVFIQLIELVEP